MLTSQLILYPDRNSGHCRTDGEDAHQNDKSVWPKIKRFPCLSFFQFMNLLASHMQLLVSFLSVSHLSVELGALHKWISISISSEHFTAHTSEALRAVLLLSCNPFIQRQCVKTQCKGQGNNIVITRWHFVGWGFSCRSEWDLSVHSYIKALEDILWSESLKNTA